MILHSSKYDGIVCFVSVHKNCTEKFRFRGMDQRLLKSEIPSPFFEVPGGAG